jgi:N-acylneuraminate cytidylyltransferase
MGRIAIIPARGGSKRIPRKNIKHFLGIPIIAYSIEAALASEIFTEVMVSTDDEEIALIAEKYGASIPFFRSNENANDQATTAAVILEVLQQYKDRFNQDFEYSCCIYPTAPFVTATRLKEAAELLHNRQAEAVIPVSAFSYPVLRSLYIDKERLMFKWPEFVSTRSQDLPSFYHDAGQFYFLNNSAFMAKQQVFMDNVVPLIIPETEVQDIDNETDWKIAEMKYQLTRER